MHYVQVENGEVVSSPKSLPVSWDNISNFNVLGNEELIQHGWYPYRNAEQQIPDGYIVDGSSCSIENNEVVEYKNIRQKSSEEVQSEINSIWENIRSQRNIYLLESDWTQLSDSPLSNQKQIEWQIYRQTLRDITNADSPYGISWPEKPSN